MIDNIPCSYKQYRARFIEESKQLIEILGNDIIEIHHYGCSAVEGLPFAEEINILPVVKSYRLINKHMADFEKIGFKAIENSADCIMFQKKEQGHYIQVKWVKEKDMDQVHSVLLIRDYLRQNQEAKEQYAHYRLMNKQQSENEMIYQLNEIEYLLLLKEQAEEWKERF